MKKTTRICPTFWDVFVFDNSYYGLKSIPWFSQQEHVHKELTENENALVVNLRQSFPAKYQCIVTQTWETIFYFNSLALHVLDCLPQMSGLGEKNWKWNFRIFKKVMFLKQFLMNVTFGDIKEANDNNALATIPSHEWSSHAPLIVSHFTYIIVKKFTWTMLLFCCYERWDIYQGKHCV